MMYANTEERPRLSVVKPIVVQSGMVSDSTVPVDPTPEWDPDTTYSDTAEVRRGMTLYKSVMADNKGKVPEENPDYWQNRGAVAEWRMFDKAVDSQTPIPSGEASFKITVVEAATYLAFLNVTGALSITVRISHPRLGQVYERTISMEGRLEEASWWHFYFGEFKTPTQALFDDIVAIPGSQIEVHLQGSPELAVGVCLVGVKREFSNGVEYGARVGSVDYSRRERTEYGQLEVVERAYTRRATLQVSISYAETDPFNDFMISVRATPCLWVSTVALECTTIYGIAKTYDIVLSYYDCNECDIDLESVV